MTEVQRLTICEAVRDLGGVVRQSALLELGYAKREIAEAVTAGGLARVRRSWLVHPDADPMLVAAARAGVVLTCITRAKRLELWVTAEDRPHVAAARSAAGVSVEREGLVDGALGDRKATVHWHRPVVPRVPHALEDSIENTLIVVAHCQPKEHALAVWESAFRQQKVDPLVLEKLPLSRRARDLLEEATPFADSGLETIVPRRLRWLRLRIVPQMWLIDRPVDFLIGERLVLQIDGGHHVDRQREADVRHDAELMLRGYHVIRVGYWQVMNDWPGVQLLIQLAVAQGLHRAR